MSVLCSKNNYILFFIVKLLIYNYFPIENWKLCYSPYTFEHIDVHVNKYYHHYKKSSPYQPMSLWFVFKSTIFVIDVSIVFCGTMVKMIYINQLQNGLSHKCNYHL